MLYEVITKKRFTTLIRLNPADSRMLISWGCTRAPDRHAPRSTASFWISGGQGSSVTTSEIKIRPPGVITSYSIHYTKLYDLEKRGIRIFENGYVEKVTADSILMNSGELLSTDFTFLRNNFV